MAVALAYYVYRTPAKRAVLTTVFVSGHLGIGKVSRTRLSLQPINNVPRYQSRNRRSCNAYLLVSMSREGDLVIFWGKSQIRLQFHVHYIIVILQPVLLNK